MKTKGISQTNHVNPVSELSSKKTAELDKNSKVKKPTASDLANKVKADGQAKSGVQVQLSDQARELAEARARALEIANNTPDVREDRVAALKEQIKQGKYKPDAQKIADGIIKEAIKDELALSMHKEARSR